MRVIPFAVSIFTSDAYRLFDELDYSVDLAAENKMTDSDLISEFAGRNCYRSFSKPNSATRSNESYLANILRIGHESILEHSSVSFYVEGVSRNLLLELERHRHLSFSVLSTRYVSHEEYGVACHPNTPEGLHDAIYLLEARARGLADVIYKTAIDDGYTNKQATEVARQVLPGNMETKFIVTGNVRAWRYVVKLRNSAEADKEIQMFAKEVLSNLKNISPNSVQDMEI